MRRVPFVLRGALGRSAGDTLIHLHELHLLQFDQDAAGAFCFRMRADEAARVAVLLDDFARARRN